MEKEGNIFGSLLNGEASFDWLKRHLGLCSSELNISICSAYIKAEIVQEILLARNDTKGRVLVRWEKKDLTSGSSDLQIYSILKNHGWSLYIDNSFHGKLYAIPGEGLLIGSANATKSGFSLFSPGNNEVCTLVPLDKQPILFIEDLFNSATLVDDFLFDLISIDIENSQKSKENDNSQWGSEVINALKMAPVNGLFVNDLFWTKAGPLFNKPISSELSHDLDLIGISPEERTSGNLKKNILKTKITRWLIEQSAGNESGIYFGELTKKLHDSLIDDPAPYRSTVKELLSNSLSWVQEYLPEYFSVDRPSHSQRLRYLK